LLEGEDSIRILLAASEVVGFAKTGGLADVAGALPAALSRRGHQCAVIMPMYRAARNSGRPVEPTAHAFCFRVGASMLEGRLWRSTLADSDVPVFLVEQPEFFDRDDPAQGRGLYQYTEANGSRRDYQDNCGRFVFFCRAVVEVIRLLDWWPDVLHGNDWQTGLIPVYLREECPRCHNWEARARYARIKTLFTVHNIAYQGNFWSLDMKLAGLDWRLFNYQQLEFYGKLSFLKAGIVFSDFVSTVSPTYAREIQTPYYGCGLQGTLSARADRLIGIVNGVDYRVWDPQTDTVLAANYGPDAVDPGKPLCKAVLQRRFGLPEKPSTPLLAVIARLAEQKGIELICSLANSVLQQDVQLVVLGQGDPRYEQMLRDVQRRFPDRVGLMLGFDEPLAHQIEAGADAFLMPSMYEPSGLNQLYSLKYGTLPIVRRTGGLADTVTDTTPQTLTEGTATGFSFGVISADAFQGAVERALNLYRTQPNQWRRVMQNGMRQDWSWDRSAAEYERLYQRIARIS
jgi:starch synthase